MSFDETLKQEKKNSFQLGMMLGVVLMTAVFAVAFMLW